MKRLMIIMCVLFIAGCSENANGNKPTPPIPNPGTPSSDIIFKDFMTVNRTITSPKSKIKDTTTYIPTNEEATINYTVQPNPILENQLTEENGYYFLGKNRAFLTLFWLFEILKHVILGHGNRFLKATNQGRGVLKR